MNKSSGRYMNSKKGSSAGDPTSTRSTSVRSASPVCSGCRDRSCTLRRHRHPPGRPIPLRGSTSRCNCLSACNSPFLASRRMVQAGLARGVLYRSVMYNPSFAIAAIAATAVSRHSPIMRSNVRPPTSVMEYLALQGQEQRTSCRAERFRRPSGSSYSAAPFHSRWPPWRFHG